MSKFVLSSEAREDLIDIYVYTEERWDEEQADRYLDSFYVIIEGLTLSSGKGRPELHPEVRSVNNGTHVVLFMPHEGEVGIVRVLHGARDIDGLFRDFDPEF
ncbi:MAG: type II toxin-antitoxin system RelE/ParE family toxin [Myxococcota bacterium]